MGELFSLPHRFLHRPSLHRRTLSNHETPFIDRFCLSPVAGLLFWGEDRFKVDSEFGPLPSRGLIAPIRQEILQC